MKLRFSQDIEALLHLSLVQPLTLREIVTKTAERGFCLTISLLALPFLFPMPPGFSSILGTGCLLLALQMAWGRRSPWLPKRLANFQFPRHLSAELLKNLQKVTRILEKCCRPRLLTLVNHPWTWRSNGLCIAWLTVLLMLPIPFTNPIPTLGILTLAVATLEGDGLLMSFGYLLTVMNTLLFGSLAYLVGQAPQLLP